MHEMSIAMAVIGQVEEAAERAGDVTAVCSVRLQVGELAGVVPEALSFCFELACAGTVLEGAELITETVPGRARCAPCAQEWAVGVPPLLSCPQCDGGRTDLLSGRELQIVGVRWEDGRTPAPVPEPIPEEC
ncbi:hydrogenase maturation nickel metallochaperone HypA [Streptomyces nodosus]|uniref:Hydrogenase maturation factor HypA n=1 Tax=Streptomyces nodosus TaxID=40318 RepID=A0A0B5DFY3_9ACTN|nr:hydrogenase maturation nickel metallochaperone HypA [Streptomyces nodosus]AJE39346.1 hydrogenase nickel incorporation protein HypA [Streptomyces nodosus]MBB4790254.1 hydrogenase nickel incorporation protein HypA/HybF [Streptomyces nodosus]QEV37930.1 hydrogenase maturation nickel metallochaperone HypA [Streptomyces nodosus]